MFEDFPEIDDSHYLIDYVEILADIVPYEKAKKMEVENMLLGERKYHLVPPVDISSSTVLAFPKDSSLDAPNTDITPSDFEVVRLPSTSKVPDEQNETTSSGSSTEMQSKNDKAADNSNIEKSLLSEASKKAAAAFEDFYRDSFESYQLEAEGLDKLLKKYAPYMKSEDIDTFLKYNSLVRIEGNSLNQEFWSTKDAQRRVEINKQILGFSQNFVRAGNIIRDQFFPTLQAKLQAAKDQQ